MKKPSATTGLKWDEPLLWEKGQSGRSAFSLPARDVEQFAVESGMEGKGPDFPDLSEPEVVRHYTRLSQWNYGIDAGLYPLGSCTMKYNPKINEAIAALPGFASPHPLLPEQFCQGTLRVMAELERFLAEITGLDAVSLQPAAGAQGELTGMLLIQAYHQARGDSRTKLLVPDTAHGTNPASATLCGYQPVAVASNDQGILSAETVAEFMDEQTAGIMVTNPNTLGLFEENIMAIAEIIHEKGGQIYCDGANMNALFGRVDMRKMGVDVLHLNLHKTFSTPHGGGGPGAGPVCVKQHLEKYLPVPRLVEKQGRLSWSSDAPDSIGRMHGFYGNFGVMVKACCYILSMGAENLQKVSELAVLNANYLKERLKQTLYLPYDRLCMHECVFTDKNQAECHVNTLDIAKRMIDYGFHPPTIYFPLVVQGALMTEPTETETRETLDAYIAAVEAIAKEARTEPELLRQAPTASRVRRLDETTAARNPCLSG